MNYQANPHSRDELRKLALQIRKQVGCDDQLYFPVMHLLEFVLPLIYPEYSVEIISPDLMGNNHGETLTDHSIIRIREDVYERACAGNGRDRLTVAHEIGHLLLHKPENVRLCRTDPSIAQMRIPAYRDPEWQASAFAGELLIPYHLAKNLSEGEIAEQCQVSISAARTQLRAFNK